MTGGSAELANELKALRKGRGLQAPKLADQVGPMLRKLCGITGTETSATMREKLSERLRNLAAALPDDLRLAVTIALALNPDTQQQFLQDRVQFLAEAQKRDVRTIRRRMDDGFELLAEIAMKPAEAQGRGTGLGWYTHRVESIVRLDKDTPECFERRTIVAEWDALDTIQTMLTLPKVADADEGNHDLLFDMYFGATVRGVQRKTEDRFVAELGLPEQLQLGDRHEYGLVWKVPPDQLMRDHYALVPDRRCDEFHLRVRFDPNRMPSIAWRVAEVFHRDLDAKRPTETLLTVDKAGELNLSFQNLLPGHGYGAQWLFG